MKSVTFASGFWRETANYRNYLRLDRPGFAWEFLRRNAGYRAFARTLDAERPEGKRTLLSPAHDAARRWGLAFAEDHMVSAWSARDLWLDPVDPTVLPIEALPAPDGRGLDITALDVELIALSHLDGREHLMLRTPVGRLRIDIVAGTALAGPIRPRVVLDGFDQMGAKLLALRRLHGLTRSGRMPTGLFAPDRRARRWANMLQVHDGLQEGASQRDLAIALYRRDRILAEWCGVSDYLKTSIRRLIRGARDMVDEGYRSLLKPPERQ